MVPELRRVIFRAGVVVGSSGGGIKWFPWVLLLLVGVGLGIAGIAIRTDKKEPKDDKGDDSDDRVAQLDPGVEDTAATGESPIVRRPAPPTAETAPSAETGPTGTERVPPRPPPKAPRPPRPPRPRQFRPRQEATGPRSVSRAQSPVDFFYGNYPPEIARPVVRAWQMADQMLGGRVEGVAGSYARGCPKVGEWPVPTARDAWILSKVPPELSPEVAVVLPPQVQALRDLRLQLGADGIPSDLDVITRVTDDAALSAARDAIFKETGIYVDFVEPMPE